MSSIFVESSVNEHNSLNNPEPSPQPDESDVKKHEKIMDKLNKEFKLPKNKKHNKFMKKLNKEFKNSKAKIFINPKNV